MRNTQGAGHVLVVDDNVINRKQLGRLLTDQGYSVTLVEDGRLAVALLGDAGGESAAFDIILLDILMPEMDGYQVLAWVKRQPHLRHIPVIMISALDEMESVVRCIELGATDYLPKPFKPGLLQARLRASLAEKRLRDLELEYLEQAGRVADAALAVEAGHFDPAMLDAVGVRDDALGRLARVFQRMAREVHLREQRLKQQLEQLRLDMEEMKRAQGEALTVYMPVDRQHALARGETLRDRTTGAALFADISGFTVLTGALAQELGLERGAEELTRTISQVYTALIDEVHRFGGSVIGFAGDAITCWFDDTTSHSPAQDMPVEHARDGRSPGQDASAVKAAPTAADHRAELAAVACGLAMQEAMALCNIITTPQGATFELAAKTAVVAGPVRRFLVGDPGIQVIEAIAGRTLDRLAAAEHAAHRGEVVVASDIAERNNTRLTIREWRTDDQGRPIAIVCGSVEGVIPAPWPDLPPDALPDAACRPWVLPVVYERASSDHKQFLSELRSVSALFISFKGIDYDADEEAGATLDAYVRWVQRVAEGYEAIFDHLTMGDKGSYICLAFGTPVSHGDDEIRAVRAALELLTPPPELAITESRRSGVGAIRIGIAAGQALVGTYGGRSRRTYGVQGDRVNLAARLMIAAPESDILCDEEIYRAAQGHVDFTALPPIRVKGFVEPVAIYRPTSLSADEGKGPAPSETAIRGRLDRLSPSEQLVLKVSSVIGPSFTVTTLTEIFPVVSEKAQLNGLLDSLVEQGLLLRGAETAAGRSYVFADGIIHHVAYASMLYMQRRHLHRRAAERCEERHQADLSPWYVILAHHWRHGGEPAKAIEYLEKAGRQAQAKGAFDEAERLFRESLELDAQAAVLSATYYGKPFPQTEDSSPHWEPARWEASPDYDGAIRYAINRLERELFPELIYHNAAHTRDDVLPAARRLATLMEVSREDGRLLEVGAAYHDIGFTVHDPKERVLNLEHERAGAEIVAQVLPGFGFTSEQIATVQGLILATRLPQSPRTPLEEILADADLDNLGRDDALERSQALRGEMSILDAPVSEIEWYRRQLKFFREHRYFTPAARRLRDNGKRKNIEMLAALLEKID